MPSPTWHDITSATLNGTATRCERMLFKFQVKECVPLGCFGQLCFCAVLRVACVAACPLSTAKHRTFCLDLIACHRTLSTHSYVTLSVHLSGTKGHFILQPIHFSVTRFKINSQSTEDSVQLF